MVGLVNSLILNILNSRFFCFNDRFSIDENHVFTLKDNAETYSILSYGVNLPILSTKFLY